MSQPDPAGRRAMLWSQVDSQRRWTAHSARGRLTAVFCSLLLFAGPAAAQNLLANPDFNLTADGWIDCDGGSEPAWLTADEADCEGSGSARLSECTVTTGFAVIECADLPPTSGVFVAARLRAMSGVVLIALNFCAESLCGECGNVELAATQGGDGQWQSVTGFKNVPPGTQSVLYIAGATDSATAADVDSTYLGLAPRQFRDDFEADAAGTGAPCRWSAVSP